MRRVRAGGDGSDGPGLCRRSSCRAACGAPWRSAGSVHRIPRFRRTRTQPPGRTCPFGSRREARKMGTNLQRRDITGHRAWRAGSWSGVGQSMAGAGIPSMGGPGVTWRRDRGRYRRTCGPAARCAGRRRRCRRPRSRPRARRPRGALPPTVRLPELAGAAARHASSWRTLRWPESAAGHPQAQSYPVRMAGEGRHRGPPLECRDGPAAPSAGCVPPASALRCRRASAGRRTRSTPASRRIPRTRALPATPCPWCW